MTGADYRELRLRLKLTPTQFADLLETTPATVGRWEKDQAVPRGLAQRRALAELAARGSEGAAGD